MFLKAVLVFILVLIERLSSAPLQKTDDVLISFQCMHVNIHGKPRPKEPVLLLHGMGADKSVWHGVYQLLAVQTGRRVCAIDLRNHGESSWSNETDIDVMTSDVAKFLEREKIEKVNLIGHSLGGKIAVHYTLNNPEKVASIIVEDMRPNGIVPQALAVVQGIIKMLRAAMENVPKGSNIEDARKFIIDFINKELEKTGYEERVDHRMEKSLPMRCSSEKCEWKMNINLIEKVLQHPELYLRESKGLYKGPALFIYGTKSPFKVGEDKQNILKLFPNAKLFPVEGAGHAIHWAHKKFDDEVVKFLNNISENM